MDIYYTSDTHSYVYPTDYVSKAPKAMGYLLAASAFTPGSIVIDGGDILQGSPLLRYESSEGIEDRLIYKAFNTAGLDVFVPGNHDFDFGYAGLLEIRKHLHGHFVCANLTDTRGLIRPEQHVVIERDGLRVFITGVVTDYVNVWDRDRLDGLEVSQALDALRREYEASLSVNADFRICVYHGGFGPVNSGHLTENAADEIAQLGFDVLLTAHQHRIIRPQMTGKSLVLQAGSRGEHYAHIVLEKGRAAHAEILPASLATEVSPAMRALCLADSSKTAAQSYLERIIGKIDGCLDDHGRISSFTGGSALADFINDIQLGLSGADVSATALVNNPVSLEGDVSMLDILSAYPFSNTLVKLEISGSQLKSAMERSAAFCDRIDGTVVESASFSPGKDERYNCDFYRGVSYTFDLSKPAGSRVTRLMFHGTDLLWESDTRLTIVLNSYRASGTGGYEVYGRLPVMESYDREIQDVLIDVIAGSSPVAVPERTDFTVV